MKAYKWSDEEAPHGELSDSLILMHLFCTFLDDRLAPNDPIRKEEPFSSRHFHVTRPDSKIDEARGAPIVIVQNSKISPPHFDLHVQSTPTQWQSWDVLRGRHNVFHTIALFAFYLKTRAKGCLRETDLGSPSVQLMEVLK